MALNPVCKNCGHKNPLIVPIFDSRHRFTGAEGEPTSVTIGEGTEYQKVYTFEVGDLVPVERVVTECGLCKMPLVPLPEEAPAVIITVKAAEEENGAAAGTGGPISDRREPGPGTTGEDAGAAGSAE